MSALYTSQDLANAFGVTHRQLQWWDERKVIIPQLAKHQRLYTERDAMLIGVVSRLRQCNLSLQAVRKLLPRIVRSLAKDTWRFLIILRPSGLLFAREPAQVIAALTEASAFSLVVDLLQITDALKERRV